MHGDPMIWVALIAGCVVGAVATVLMVGAALRNAFRR